MIILVKIGPITDPLIDVILFSAYLPWACDRLLDDAVFRNKHKYLVAYSEGVIVGTFYIHGVSLYFPFYGDKRSVQFKFENTDTKCNQHLKNVLQPLIINRYPKIMDATAFCYLEESDLSQSSTPMGIYKCNGVLKDIPVLDSEKVVLKNQSNKAPVVASIPNELWFKLTLRTTTWDYHNAKGFYYDIVYHNGNIEGKVFKSYLPHAFALDETMLNQIKHIICVCHQDPEAAVQKIKNANISSESMQVKLVDFQFDAFCDERLINRVQHTQGVIRLKQTNKSNPSTEYSPLKISFDALIA